MNIVVCLKQILDPEIPARDFSVDTEKLEARQGSASLVTNIFCENALETALQFRERSGGAKITVLSYGPASAEDSLRKGLAMKADAAALVLNESDSNPDPLRVAQVLAAAIKKLGIPDLIMLGRESGDWGVGQTGGLLAEELGLPCLSFVDHIETVAGQLLLKRQTESGWEQFEAKPPVVVTITNNEYNVPRIPKVRDVMSSYRQPLETWRPEDLGIAAETTNQYYEVVELFVPVKETSCEFAQGDSLNERVEAFAQRIVAVINTL
ncbi:MAG TPA: electron transfer flavoprotein subunit beta/FixA family protein [Pyrinomonadaceae bacterium]|nr:electron transfer flavoprotein subunit beta/FixA family protein [Pyrinomonadaceae bacterium]